MRLICDASFNNSLNLLLPLNTYYLCSASPLPLGISGDFFVPLKKKKGKNIQATTLQKQISPFFVRPTKALYKTAVSHWVLLRLRKLRENTETESSLQLNLISSNKIFYIYNMYK